MSMDIDVTASPDELAAEMTSFVENNKAELQDMPQEKQVEIMTNIYHGMSVLMNDGTEVLTEDTSWAAFKERPSSYLIPDVDKLAERAAMYADDEHVELLQHAFETEAFDEYLVTGFANDVLARGLPAVAEAYREMHDHDLAEIPKQMTQYTAQFADRGFDEDIVRERLIHPVADPMETAQFERRDIAHLAAMQGIPERDLTEFNRIAAEIRETTELNFDGDNAGPLSKFEALDSAYMQTEATGYQSDFYTGWEKAADEIVVLSDLKDQGKLNEVEIGAYDAFVPALVEQNRAAMIASYDFMASRHASFEANDPTVPDHQKEAEETALFADASERRERFEVIIADMPDKNSVYFEALAKATDEYRDMQLDLGKVERVIIDNSKVYSSDGVSQVLQETVNAVAETGRSNVANPEVGRNILAAFVALEGKEAMQDIANGNVEVLANYVDTPANQNLAAKELLTSAKQVDVGLDIKDIDRGLDAVDPSRSIDSGLSL